MVRQEKLRRFEVRKPELLQDERDFMEGLVVLGEERKNGVPRV